MIELEPAHLEQVRDLLRKNVPHCHVWIFGSRASGRASPYSDLDIALHGDDKILPALLAALRRDVASLGLPFRVEIVDLEACTAAQRQDVLAHGEPLKL